MLEALGAAMGWQPYTLATEGGVALSRAAMATAPDRLRNSAA